jgi:hypothetical protein
MLALLAGITSMEVQRPLEEAHNEEAWERYMEAERRELQMRREGHLAKLLGRALANESPEELKRIAEEDRLRAQEGLVELMDKRGKITYKRIDELVLGDRTARTRAEGVRIEWLAQRWARKRHLQPSLGQADPATR